MPKVTDEYRASRREEIAAAAMRAFHRKGFQATSMADIIAESGLSAGAIYGHFKSKNEIILEVSTKIIGARLGEVEELAAREPMPAPAQLVRVLMGGMLHDIGRPAMLVQVWGESMTDPLVHDLANRVMSRLRSVYTDYIVLWHERQNGLSPAAARALADEQVVLFLASAQGFIIQSALFDDFDSDAFLSSIEKYLPR
ncbi:MAG: hypothetical protein JWR04_1893 [Rhodoglobus sp.]|nr:hypothetical protein [Rhodoglobus sp.]